jgi:Holliday junction resolvase RusA-like endonuclease
MIRINIFDFPRKVEISKARKVKYFKQTDELPEKYKHAQYTWKKKGKYTYLFDTAYDEFVIKNPKAAGTPRYAYVSGNEIYARMHERIRIKIVGAVKDSFKEAICKTVKDKEDFLRHVRFPVSIRMEIYTPYDYANWDVDNLWIYHKCFLDAMKDLGIFEDDNILFVREAGATKFFPLSPDETPLMSFFITNSETYPKATEVVRVVENFTEKPGLLLIDPSGKTAEIAVGKTKVLFGAAKDAIRKLHYYCLNYNKSVAISRSLYEKYKNFFEDFPKSNIEIIYTA